MSYLPEDKDFQTRAIHTAQHAGQWSSQSIVPPISLSTTFQQDGPANPKDFEYGRSGNPSRNILEKCLAELDKGKYGLCFASGLGATTCVVQMLQSGDHVLCMDDVYGGINRYFSKIATKFKVEVSYAPFDQDDKWPSMLKPNTKLIWLECPTNPMMKISDIRAICKRVSCTHPEILVVVDNTFLTSFFQKPLSLGADIVLYSLTKYVNGHSDVIMGAAIMNSEKIYEDLKFLQNACGVVPSPFDCYLVNRSLKTLGIRMKVHMENGLKVAKFLEQHPKVEKVLHPGLESHPGYEISLKQCSGCCGTFSFYLKGELKEATAFLKALKYFSCAESLGGYESLASLPSLMTHASVPAEERSKLGIFDNLIRLSVGLENSEDLVQDLKNALESC